MISFQENCGRLEVSLCYRLTTWDGSVVGVSPTPITVSGIVPSEIVTPVVPVPSVISVQGLSTMGQYEPERELMVK